MLVFEPGQQQIDTERGVELPSYRLRRPPVEMQHRQLLLEPLEKNFDVPARLIDVSDLLRRPVRLIRHEKERRLPVGITIGDQAQHAPKFSSAVAAGKADVLIRQDARAGFNRALAHHVVACSISPPGDKNDLPLAQFAEPAAVEIAAVKTEHRSLGERPVTCHRPFTNARRCDIDQRGELSAVIERHMQFDASALRRPYRPVMQRVTDADDGGVQTVKLSVKTERCPGATLAQRARRC